MQEVGVSFLWKSTAQAYLTPGVQDTQKPLVWSDLLWLLTMVSSLKYKIGVLISAGPNSYMGQVRSYSKKQLKSVFTNALL